MPCAHSWSTPNSSYRSWGSTNTQARTSLRGQHTAGQVVHQGINQRRRLQGEMATGRHTPQRNRSNLWRTHVQAGLGFMWTARSWTHHYSSGPWSR